MTISFSVAEILRAPASHARDRVVATGVLYLDEELRFRIFQKTAVGYDQRVFIDIDDPEAAAKLRAVLIEAGRAPDYLGPGLVDGRARLTERGLVLEQILTVHVGAPFERPRNMLTVNVRPNPFAR